MSGHDGGCLCGMVRYRVGAEAERVAYCHCKFCQRSTGSAFAVEPFFAVSAFRLLEGTPKVFLHKSAGSGLMLYVHFCDTCGTKIYNLFDRYPGVVGVMGGTFDDPNWFEPAKIMRHVFTASARPGTIIPPGVNTYEGPSLALDGQPIPPIVFDKFHIL